MDKHIKLLDSPGIVLAKDDSDATAALHNSVQVMAQRESYRLSLALQYNAQSQQLGRGSTIPGGGGGGEGGRM